MPSILKVLSFLNTVKKPYCAVAGAIYPWDLTMQYWLKYKFRDKPLPQPDGGVPEVLIIIGVGWQQDKYAMMRLAHRLARDRRAQVMFLENDTQADGDEINNATFEHVSSLNYDRCKDAIRKARIMGIPVIGIGFSKGGLDLIWLAKRLFQEAGVEFDHIWTYCSPFRGSKIAKHGSHPNVNMLNPGNPVLQTVQDMAIDLMWASKVELKYYASWLDPIVDASDARPPRPPEHADRKIDPVNDRKRKWFARWIPGGFAHNVMNYPWVLDWISRQVGIVVTNNYLT